MAVVSQPRYRFGFILSTLLGNKTRYETLRKFSSGVPDVHCVWAPVRHYYLEDEVDPVRHLPDPLHTRAVTIAQAWPVLKCLTKLDAVMVHQFEVSSLLATIPKTSKKPIVIGAHDNPPVLNRHTYPLYPEQRNKAAWRAHIRRLNDVWAARRAGYFIGFSEWSAEIMRECGLASNHVAAQHVGLDLSKWIRPNRDLKTSDQKSRLLFVGGDFERKGGLSLLNALYSDLTDRFTLDIVTKTTLTAVPNNCRVYYDLGPGDSRLIELFHQADIFVFPTEADLVPWVVLEAMASQCAIVASRIGGIPDMVTPECGILIDPTDGNALREALLTLAESPERREAMGLAARQRIEAAYDASKNVPKIFELMKRWIDERRRAHEKIA